MKKDLTIAFILVALGVLTRLVPHGWNMTLMGAVALSAGFLISRKSIAVLVPLAAVIVSDLFLGFHSTIYYVYGAYILMVALASVAKGNRWGSVLATSALGSFLFFIITNFGVWHVEGIYPYTLSGLMQSYMMGIPFYRAQFLIDVVGSFGLVYGFKFLFQKVLRQTLSVKEFSRG